MEDINVFIMDPSQVDLEVYGLWLKGLSETEASANRITDGSLAKYGASHTMIEGDTRDQFRLFDMIEHFLQNPVMLSKQLLVQLPPGVQETLIEMYYQFDKDVIRELLGKKLTGRQRKDLDDVSEKTGVSLKSCRRQFDNIKNVYRVIEDGDLGTLSENIKRQFLLSDDLSRKYAGIIFMAVHRFEVSKKRLQYLSFDDLSYCAEQMIDSWTVGTEEGGTGQDIGESGAEFDRAFLQDLRDLRVFASDKDIVEEHKMLVCMDFQKNVSNNLTKSVEANFKNLSRTLLNIAAGLIHTKEVKDLFSDLQEKIIEPCKQLEWDGKFVDKFFALSIETCSTMETLKRHNLERLCPIYKRYVSVCQKCVNKMYHGS